MPDLEDGLSAALQRIRDRLRWYRRPAAAALLVIAVLTALLGLVGEEPTVPVLVARADLAAGVALSAEDVAIARMPPRLVPTGALDQVPAAVGRTTALPVAAGEPLTPLRFVDRPLLDALREAGSPELVAAGATLADATVAALVRPGDVVDVLAAGEGGSGGTVLAGVRVLLANAPEDSGSFGSAGSRPAQVVLAITQEQSAALARSASTSRLTLALHGRSG